MKLGAEAAVEVELPEEFARTYYGNDEPDGRAWASALPDLAAGCLRRWRLRTDPAAASGFGCEAVVLPVLREDGSRAALKLQRPGGETRGEPIALRAWNGYGAVRLLEHDPVDGSMLLERLDASRCLLSVPDDVEAAQVIAGLLVRLNSVEPPPGLRHVRDVAAGMLDAVPRALPTIADPEDRALIGLCAGAVREVVGEPGDRLLHWDLHYENVLAALPDAGREPWVAIDPKPLLGDPGFELMPALFNRWEEAVATGDPGRAARRRFDAMTEVMGLDRERARAWTLARVLQNVLWGLADDGRVVDPVQAEIARGVLRQD